MISPPWTTTLLPPPSPPSLPTSTPPRTASSCSSPSLTGVKSGPPMVRCPAPTGSPGPAASTPIPRGRKFEGRVRRAAPRRRRLPVCQSARVGHPAPAAAGGLIVRHCCHSEPLSRHRHRLRDRHRALARGAHRLRPRIDGRDGVVGFGRYSSRGGTCGWGLESVVVEVGRANSNALWSMRGTCASCVGYRRSRSGWRNSGGRRATTLVPRQRWAKRL